MLFLAIGVLGLVVAAGGWLARGYLLTDEPPAGLGRAGLVHGAGGLIGAAVLAAALRGPPPSAHAVKMGVGGFGLFSGGLIAGAALAGLTILITHLRRRTVSAALVATHGMLGISGYTLLVTYLTMLH